MERGCNEVLRLAEKLVVAVFDVLIRLDVALEETFGIGCNPRFFGGYLLYFFKIVRAVDFPALQEADVDSGCGTAERTTHTGEAVVVETDAAGGITIDIAGGAGVDAAVAVDALLGVDFVEERVDRTGDIHGSGNNAAYDVGPKRGTLDVGDYVVTSPDGQLKATVSDDGMIKWSIEREGVKVLEPSAIRIATTSAA